MKISLLLLILILSSCGMRSIPMAFNEVDASWAEVQNQYKRRSDLIPNLVNTVKAYAKHEKSTLNAVIKARASATQTKIDASNLTTENIVKFQRAQGALSNALSRLMVVSERYPQLKSNQNFRDLQHQLEGTENRITVARNRYIRAIKVFNDLVTVPPESWYNAIFLKHKKKPQFMPEDSEEIKKAPEVKF